MASQGQNHEVGLTRPPSPVLALSSLPLAVARVLALSPHVVAGLASAVAPQYVRTYLGTDYYAVLDVSEKTTFQGLKQAYERQLLTCGEKSEIGGKKWSSNDPQVRAKVHTKYYKATEAFHVLSDNQLRGQYDTERRGSDKPVLPTPSAGGASY